MIQRMPSTQIGFCICPESEPQMMWSLSSLTTRNSERMPSTNRTFTEANPHALSPSQVQRFLGLPSTPIYTLARMAKVGILKKPPFGLYAIADEHMQLMERLEGRDSNS